MPIITAAVYVTVITALIIVGTHAWFTVLKRPAVTIVKGLTS